jgi:hypothetical protein
MNRRLVFGLGAVLAVGACNDQENTAPTEPSDAPPVAFGKSSSPSYVIGFSTAQAGNVKAAIERAGGKAGFISTPGGARVTEWVE